MIIRLYTAYDKHEMIKISNGTREKSQVLPQVLELFYCRLLYISCRENLKYCINIKSDNFN